MTIRGFGAGILVGMGISASVAMAQYYAPPAAMYRAPPSPHYQPYMVDALSALHHAYGMLNSAPLDKGGHRIRAMTAVTQAINETQAGIDYANTHD